MNESKPTISILVPTYNRREKLFFALESIKNQTFKNFEVIVINDGGKNVERVINKFQFPKINKKSSLDIKYINNNQNRGLFPSLNLGLKIAKGFFITELDDDDTFRPDALEKLLSGFTDNSIKAVYGKANRTLPSGKKDVFARNLCEKDIFKINWTTCNRMFKTEIFKEIGNFDEYFKALGDWDMNIRVALKYGIDSWKFVDSIIVDVVSHTGSMTCNHQDIFAKESLYIKTQKNYSKFLEKSLSIIIPTYHGHRYIRTAVISALECTDRKHEVIVVNDGGDPNESKLLDGLPIKYYYLKENKGIANALNFGIDKTLYNYILWHGYDDELYKNGVNSMLDLFNDGIVMTYGDFDIIYHGDREAMTCKKQEYNKDYFKKINGLGKFVMYPRSVQNIIGNYNIDLKICLDLDYWFRLSKIGIAKKTNKIVGLCRIRNESYSNSNRELAELEIKKIRNEHSIHDC